jgi:superfamily I DNA and/or RNA helicase
LVGDPYQLSGTVVSLKAKELGYGRSLMGRLMDECKMPSTLLDVQYRMHPDIASFSNISFYGGRVKNDPIVQQPKYNDWKIHALRAFHVEGAEKREGEGGGSIQNLQETYVVVAAVNVLLSSGYKPDQIGVISPYASQARSIKATLRSQKIEVECHTVDAFQVCERPGRRHAARLS